MKKYYNKYSQKTVFKSIMFLYLIVINHNNINKGCKKIIYRTMRSKLLFFYLMITFLPLSPACMKKA